jgi:DNA invertase Pin-like site-specific DNA recombinase
MRAALYARVSTADQTTANQLIDLRHYAAARAWRKPIEYVDEGVSGSKDSRPALDRFMKDARRRKVDVLVVWKLDRLGRSLRHLILLLDELSAARAARKLDQFAARKVDHLQDVDSTLPDAAGVRSFRS